MDAYQGLNATQGTFNPIQISDYKERYSYDPDGSIQTLLRHGQGKTIDSAAWNYYPNTHRLNNINDPAGSYGFDAGVQSANNYQYDSIGEMTSDAERGLTNITWSVYGKVLQQTGNGETINYSYNASNNRISKIVSGTANYSEYYVRDASGNVMCIYRNDSTGFKPIEYDVYGSKRLGHVDTLTVKPDSIELGGDFGSAALSVFTRGETIFDLTDYRGNDLVEVSDKKLAVDSNHDGLIDYYSADVITAQQYSSFGSLLDGQQYGNTPRYTYNGKQLDKETGWQDYGMREYLVDEPIFASVDPLTKKYPELTPYQFASNTPIMGADLDGLEVIQENFDDAPNPFYGPLRSDPPSNPTGKPTNKKADIPTSASKGAVHAAKDMVNGIKSLNTWGGLGRAVLNVLGGVAMPDNVDNPAPLEIPKDVNPTAYKAGYLGANLLTLGLFPEGEEFQAVDETAVVNPVPPSVVRVVPADIKTTTLGAPNASDVFVTDPVDILGLNATQIAKKLTIPESPSGFNLIEFPTPEGIASPINRTNPGFIGGGKTAGNASEFVVPNQPIPANATQTTVH